MQLSFNILEALYLLINVPTVTNEIPELYIGNPSKTAQGEFISVNMLTNPNKYVQSGYCNVNIHTTQLAGGRHNLSRFKQVVPLISELLEDSTITHNNQSYHFQVDDDKGVFNDEDRDGMSYYNLRLTFQTI